MRLFSIIALLLFTPTAFNPWTAGVNGDVIMWNAGASPPRFDIAQVSLSRDAIVTFNNRRTAVWMATGDAGGTVSGTGFSYGTTLTRVGSGGTTGQAPDANNPVRARDLSGATTGNDAGIQGNQLTLRTGRNLRLVWHVDLTSTANVRVAMGLTDQNTVVTMVGSDNPAGNYAYFRYSTPAPDTNWQCITKDNATQTVTDSTVAADTNGHDFEIRENVTAATWTFYIDGVNVCSHSTNLPSASTNMAEVIGLETRTGSAKSIDLAWGLEESDK